MTRNNRKRIAIHLHSGIVDPEKRPRGRDKLPFFKTYQDGYKDGEMDGSYNERERQQENINEGFKNGFDKGARQAVLVLNAFLADEMERAEVSMSAAQRSHEKIIRGIRGLCLSCGEKENGGPETNFLCGSCDSAIEDANEESN